MNSQFATKAKWLSKTRGRSLGGEEAVLKRTHFHHPEEKKRSSLHSRPRKRGGVSSKKGTIVLCEKSGREMGGGEGGRKECLTSMT